VAEAAEAAKAVSLTAAIAALTAAFVGGPVGVAIGGAALTGEVFKHSFSVEEAENNMRLAQASDAKVAQADAAAGNYARFGMSKLDALEAVRMGSDLLTKVLTPVWRFCRLSPNSTK
jgi:hypothetical protein